MTTNMNALVPPVPQAPGMFERAVGGLRKWWATTQVPPTPDHSAVALVLTADIGPTDSRLRSDITGAKTVPDPVGVLMRESNLTKQETEAIQTFWHTEQLLNAYWGYATTIQEQAARKVNSYHQSFAGTISLALGTEAPIAPHQEALKMAQSMVFTVEDYLKRSRRHGHDYSIGRATAEAEKNALLDLEAQSLTILRERAADQAGPQARQFGRSALAGEAALPPAEQVRREQEGQIIMAYASTLKAIDTAQQNMDSALHDNTKLRADASELLEKMTLTLGALMERANGNLEIVLSEIRALSLSAEELSLSAEPTVTGQLENNLTPNRHGTVA